MKGWILMKKLFFILFWMFLVIIIFIVAFFCVEFARYNELLQENTGAETAMCCVSISSPSVSNGLCEVAL